MKSPVSTLVRAILKGNLVQAQEAFDATMRPRVQAALEVERVAVAKTITECPVMEDEEDPKVEEDTDPEDDKKDDLQEEDEDEDESEGGLEEHAVAGMDVKASGSDKWVVAKGGKTIGVVRKRNGRYVASSTDDDEDGDEYVGAKNDLEAAVKLLGEADGDSIVWNVSLPKSLGTPKQRDWQCLECGKTFKKLVDTCSKCGGSDIDLNESVKKLTESDWVPSHIKALAKGLTPNDVEDLLHWLWINRLIKPRDIEAFRQLPIKGRRYGYSDWQSMKDRLSESLDPTIKAVADVIRAAGFNRMAQEFEQFPGARDTVLKTVMIAMERDPKFKQFVPRLQALSDRAMGPQRAAGKAAFKRWVGPEKP
jgi:hypothetical protein